MRTEVYHATFFTYGRSFYAHYFSCSFKCRGCIRRLTVWDTHLPQSVVRELNRFYLRNLSEIKLSLEGFRSLVSFARDVLGAKSAILGGGEPLEDPLLGEEIAALNRLGLGVRLLTNGFNLDEYLELLRDVGASIVVSIKHVDESKHVYFTGFSNSRILGNIERAYSLGLDVYIETVLIPGFNDPSDVERLAERIAAISPEISLIIDAYIPVPGTGWRAPSQEEIEEAAKRAAKHLRKVYARSRNSKPIGDIVLLYPVIPLPIPSCPQSP